MAKVVSSWVMYLLATIVAFGSGWSVWVIYNDPRVGPDDVFMLWLLAIVLALFSLYGFISELWGDRILKAMYGEFSNRNPWGR